MSTPSLPPSDQKDEMDQHMSILFYHHDEEVIVPCTVTPARIAAITKQQRENLKKVKSLDSLSLIATQKVNARNCNFCRSRSLETVATSSAFPDTHSVSDTESISTALSQSSAEPLVTLSSSSSCGTDVSPVVPVGTSTRTSLSSVAEAECPPLEEKKESTNPSTIYICDTLDILFLLYEKIEDQVHNRNFLSFNKIIQANCFVDINNKDEDKVEEILIHFLTTDPTNHKLIVYVGHHMVARDGDNSFYCGTSPDCAEKEFSTGISEERIFHTIENYMHTEKVYLAFISSTSIDQSYKENDHLRASLIKSVSGERKSEKRTMDRSLPCASCVDHIEECACGKRQVHVLWHPSMASSSSVLGCLYSVYHNSSSYVVSRRDYEAYHLIEEVINNHGYENIRFYEE